MKRAPRSSAGDRRFFLISLAVFIVSAGLVFATRFANLPPNAQPTPGQRMTLDPQVRANLTQIVSPLSSEGLDDLAAVERMVAACPDYSDERRGQMTQHVAWIRDPDALPNDLVLSLGPNPVGRLLFGMGTYTEIEWRLRDMPPESCLLPIGQALNALIVQAGEARIAAFDGE